MYYHKIKDLHLIISYGLSKCVHCGQEFQIAKVNNRVYLYDWNGERVYKKTCLISAADYLVKEIIK